MKPATIDLRSDTVTQPTLGMRKAMAEADVGDDVYGEDPTVRRLEHRVADLLGMEAALFVPSGTMANQLAVRASTTPGDEVIFDASGHSFAYESGALAAVCGVQAKTISTADGVMSADAIAAAINPPADHFAATSMVIVENTANRGGGTIYPAETLDAIVAVCAEHRLKLHMDGARLWNAHVASGEPLRKIAGRCDSVAVCLSKGLGAPVGSLVAGKKAFISRAHRFRKMLGGGMRQSGILAAAGLYALEHNLERLAEDHANLRRLAEGLADIDGLSCTPERHPTNIAYAAVDAAPQIAERLADAGVLVHAMGPTELRFVTHLHIDAQAIDEALARTRAVLTGR